MNPDKKILFVCYHFPPDSAVGSVRPAKFAKYLKSFDWDPYIITIKEKYIPEKDYGRMKDVEGIRIFRTALWPSILQIGIITLDKFKNFMKPRTASHQTNNSNGKKPDEKRPEGSREKIKRYLNSVCEFPDKQIGWLIPCLWRAYRVIKKEKINILVTSSPPRTVALIGLFLTWVTDIKLLTDLRDPLFMARRKPDDCRSTLSDRTEKWLEKKIIEKSSRVITTTEHYTEFLRNLYAFLPQEKFVTIWNGYDSEDFGFIGNLQDGSTKKNSSTKKIFFTYLGTFYFGRTPKAFLTAVSELINEGILRESEIEIRFGGAVRYSEGEFVENLVRSLGLANCVTIMDRKPYKESLRIMRESDVLLLFAPDQYYSIPAKAFEYLAAGKAILCFSKEGATADLVRKYGAGIVVPPEDVKEIKKAVENLYSAHKLGRDWKYENNPAVFERKYLSENLAGVIQEAVS